MLPEVTLRMGAKAMPVRKHSDCVGYNLAPKLLHGMQATLRYCG